MLAGSFVLAAPSEVVVSLVQNAGLLSRVPGHRPGGRLPGSRWATWLPSRSPASRGAAAAHRTRGDRGGLWSFCLPLVATGPVLRVLFGPGEGPQITLAALAVYYTTMIPVLVGLRAAPAGWFDLVHSYGRGGAAALRYVRARACLPYLVAGLQIAAPAAFLGAMVGEFTGAESGLGVPTIRASRDLDIELTWALATVATVASVAAYAAIGAIGRRFVTDAPPIILAPPRPRASTGRRLRDAVWTAGAFLVVIVALWWGGIVVTGLSLLSARTPSTSSGSSRRRRRRRRPVALLAALAETAAGSTGVSRRGWLPARARRCCWCWPSDAAGMPVAIALRAVPIVTTAPLVLLLGPRCRWRHHAGGDHGVLPDPGRACLQGLRAGTGPGAGLCCAATPRRPGRSSSGSASRRCCPPFSPRPG
ncbi:MAG: ABC transporter permease subunit [Micropruina sp.]